MHPGAPMHHCTNAPMHHCTITRTLTLTLTLPPVQIWRPITHQTVVAHHTANSDIMHDVHRNITRACEPPHDCTKPLPMEVRSQTQTQMPALPDTDTDAMSQPRDKPYQADLYTSSLPVMHTTNAYTNHTTTILPGQVPRRPLRQGLDQEGLLQVQDAREVESSRVQLYQFAELPCSGCCRGTRGSVFLLQLSIGARISVVLRTVHTRYISLIVIVFVCVQCAPCW